MESATKWETLQPTWAGRDVYVVTFNTWDWSFDADLVGYLIQTRPHSHLDVNSDDTQMFSDTMFGRCQRQLWDVMEDPETNLLAKCGKMNLLDITILCCLYIECVLISLNIYGALRSSQKRCTQPTTICNCI